MKRRLTALFTVLPCAGAAQAAREPVLEQVDRPRDDYGRELSLPQLTTGPSSASFLPDSNTLIDRMEGSLWRQRIGDATELTHATGTYDDPPDISHDGRRVVFARYDGNAIERGQRDLASASGQAPTSGGADPGVLDLPPYATTHPGRLGAHLLAPSAREDAAWFARGRTRAINALALRDDDTAAEKRVTLDHLTRARDACRVLACDTPASPSTGATR